jgi:hypothetical protein
MQAEISSVFYLAYSFGHHRHSDRRPCNVHCHAPHGHYHHGASSLARLQVSGQGFQAGFLPLVPGRYSYQAGGAGTYTLSQVQAIRKTGRTTQASAHDHPDPPIVVESKELVPGDLVSVKSGDLVPADCIIISSHAFSVSQSMLTGEILPVDKAEHPHPNEKHPLDPLSAINVVLSGSSVSAGEAVLLVVTTGKSEFRLGEHVLTS